MLSYEYKCPICGSLAQKKGNYNCCTECYWYESRTSEEFWESERADQDFWESEGIRLEKI